MIQDKRVLGRRAGVLPYGEHHAKPRSQNVVGLLWLYGNSHIRMACITRQRDTVMSVCVAGMFRFVKLARHHAHQQDARAAHFLLVGQLHRPPSLTAALEAGASQQGRATVDQITTRCPLY